MLHIDGSCNNGEAIMSITKNICLKYSALKSLIFVVLSLVATIYHLQAANNTTQIQYLSGTDKDHTVPWQFYITGGGRSNNVLTTIPVPSCWQTKGFGLYGYGNHSGNGSVTQSQSVGQYTTTFFVPASWAGQRIYLV